LPDKILVADDVADTLTLTKRILEKYGLQVVTAVDGEEALLKAEAEIPDLIMLDWKMPKKDGVEVCKILKSQAKTKQIPILLFSASANNPAELVAEGGADGYLSKPFVIDLLITEVKKHLQKNRDERYLNR
jgi:CheY-like chemotaxis protein